MMITSGKPARIASFLAIMVMIGGASAAVAGSESGGGVVAYQSEIDGFAWDDATCDAEKPTPYMRITVHGIRGEKGNIRFALYTDDPDRFLEKGEKLIRADVPARKGSIEVCLPLPGHGAYALALLHDADADGGFDVFQEGYGFSNNPKVRFGAPSVDDVKFTASVDEVDLDIEMSYFFPDRDSSSQRRRRR